MKNLIETVANLNIAELGESVYEREIKRLNTELIKSYDKNEKWAIATSALKFIACDLDYKIACDLEVNKEILKVAGEAINAYAITKESIPTFIKEDVDHTIEQIGEFLWVVNYHVE